MFFELFYPNFPAMRKKQILKYLIFCSFLFLFSCNSEVVFEKNIEIKNGWHKDTLAKFSVDIQDISVPYDIYFNINNNNEYSNSNLWLFLTIVSPTKTASRDTFNCHLADRTGKWYGRESWNTWKVQIPYRTKIGFPKKGKYIFGIQQAMRTDVLQGIESIGLSIEKSQDKSK